MQRQGEVAKRLKGQDDIARRTGAGAGFGKLGPGFVKGARRTAKAVVGDELQPGHKLGEQRLSGFGLRQAGGVAGLACGQEQIAERFPFSR